MLDRHFARPRLHAALHAHGRRTDGLHARRHAQRHPGRFRHQLGQPDEPGHARPSGGAPSIWRFI